VGSVNYIDGEGSIIIPKSVRPIIGYEETLLGTKKGAKKQFRYGRLHIREYKDYYVVHMDKVDPRKDPLGHLLIDAPEYLAATIAGISAAKQAGYVVYEKKEATGLVKGLTAASLASTIAATSSCILTRLAKQMSGSI
jgi:hypothetical protein